MKHKHLFMKNLLNLKSNQGNFIKVFIVFNLLIHLFSGAIANNNARLTQTVRGIIVDKDSRSPLIGANVIILGTSPAMGTATDVDGNFRIENVPVGRITLQLSYLGYEDKTIPNVIVETGKETVLDFDMTESLLQLNEVLITGGRKKGEVLNEMALVSSHAISVEETKRYAGSLDDPSRMVSAFAGVTSDPQGLNEIVVRGNSPKGIQWRLEGVDIPNPNHFGDESSTGGPINALSSNMLGTSDFYMSAFAPEYGNVTSGIFDMKIRNGNNEKHEYTLGIGALGIDVSGEGPLEKRGSYLFNYRYSSLALLDNLKLVDFKGIPKYQDLSFKINMPSKSFGNFSIFGLGGISSINQELRNSNDKLVERGVYKSLFGTVGLNHVYQINDESFIKTTLAVSDNGSKANFESINESDEFQPANQGDIFKTTVTASTRYSNKINAQHRVVVGLDYKQFYYDMVNSYYDAKSNSWRSLINLQKDAGLFQAFLSWKYRMIENLTFVSGLHYTNFLLNNSQAIEPRVSLEWEISPRSNLHAGYGMHSITESIITYYTTLYDNEGNASTPNKDLGLTRANHYILGYDYQIRKNLNLKAEVYYQDLYDVPVENIASTYSILNEQNGFTNKQLVNKGKGRNYGVELTIERSFDKRFYFLTTGSLYKSEYKTLENVWHNTMFNGNFATNFLIGKEFVFGDEKKDKFRVLNLSTRVMYNGGRRYLPLDLEASQLKGKAVFNTENAYKDKMNNIFQMNVTASLKFNRPHTSHEILIDIYNVLNNHSPVAEYYNSYSKQKEISTQLAMMPNIMYRIHF